MREDTRRDLVLRRRVAWLVVLTTILLASQVDGQQQADLQLAAVPITTTDAPPEWAIWERLALEQLYPAACEFVEKYTRPDGTLIWREEWPGMDGSDDTSTRAKHGTTMRFSPTSWRQ